MDFEATRQSSFYVLDKELQFMNWELQLTRPVRTHRSDLPEIIRTLGDAVDMIDEHLPETLRIRPVWQQVKDMLVTAAETRKGHDVETPKAHKNPYAGAVDVDSAIYSIDLI